MERKIGSKKIEKSYKANKKILQIKWAPKEIYDGGSGGSDVASGSAPLATPKKFTSPGHHPSSNDTPQSSAHDIPTGQRYSEAPYRSSSYGSSDAAGMAPAPPGVDEHVGPHPSFIEIAKPYIFEQRIQEHMTAIGMSETREDAVRLQGVAWIDNVRKSMQLYVVPSHYILLASADICRPVRTFNTAVVYYHKFRLLHADTEYNFVVSATSGSQRRTMANDWTGCRCSSIVHSLQN